MDARTIWLLIFVCLYGAGCLYWAAKGAEKSGGDGFDAGMPGWMFLPSATAATLGGWAFVHHAGAVYEHGLPYAFAGLGAVAVPLAGALFFRRQWLLSRHLGAATPGRLLAVHFRSEALRFLTLAVAILAAVPLLALVLRGSGLLIGVATGGAVSGTIAMWLLAALLALYVVWGGLRGTALAAVAQCALFAVGGLALAAVALADVGGWSALGRGLAALAGMGEEHRALFAVAGVFPSAQATAGLPWTAGTVLTFTLALAGMATMPALSAWALASRSPGPFAAQQVWASGLLFGFVLVAAVTTIGLSGHLIGANADFAARFPELSNPTLAPFLRGDHDAAHLSQAPGGAEALVPLLITRLYATAPWMVGFMAVCALAAMQATGAVLAYATGAMIARDAAARSGADDDGTAGLATRLAVGGLVLAALALASLRDDGFLVMGGIAFAFGLQMAPALLALCWAPWFTREGLVCGLVAGLLAVAATDAPGAGLAALPWGPWPLTLHSAFWGLAANFSVAAAISAMTGNEEERRHREAAQRAIRKVMPGATRRRPSAAVGWALVLAWAFLAVGPGIGLANTLFGASANPAGWALGLPPLWTWLLLGWLTGVALLWFLAYRMRLSTGPEGGASRAGAETPDR